MHGKGNTAGRRRRLTACLLCLSAIVLLTACGRLESASKERLDVWFFACSDDADSILLQNGDTDILIDTGLEDDSEELLRKLSELGVDRVDLLILTHPDKDHIGGAERVLDELGADLILQTDCVKDSELWTSLQKRLLRENARFLRETERYSYGKLQLTVYPPREAEYESSNNYSIAALAEYEGKRFFFAGDAKKKRIEELLDEALPEADVYKLAHHGRDNGASKALIERLHPTYAVVTAREPEEETAAALSGIGAVVCRTYMRDVHFTVKSGILDVE